MIGYGPKRIVVEASIHPNIIYNFGTTLSIAERPERQAMHRSEHAHFIAIFQHGFRNFAAANLIATMIKGRVEITNYECLHDCSVCQGLGLSSKTIFTVTETDCVA